MTSDKVAEKAQQTDLVTEVNSMALDEMDLAGIGTVDGFMDALGEAGAKAEVYDDKYSSGFVVASRAEQDSLIGRPLAVIQWRFTQSKKFYDDNGNPSEFVTAYIVTWKDDNTIDGKWIINDGGVGICRTLQRIRDQRVRANHPRPQAGLVVKHGLRVSEYDTEIDGKPVRGKTYYFA